MRLTKFFGGFAALFSLAVVLTACGGGSSGAPAAAGAATTALKVASKVSLVDAQQPGSGSVATGAGVMVRALGIGVSSLTGTDYSNDKTNVYVNERSVESFKTINEILCMVGQTRYDAMMNKGVYIAQIDNNQCSSNKDNASSAGQQSTNESSGAAAPNYESWTVDSSRASDTAPQIVKAWVHESGQGQNDVSKTIEAYLVINEGASASNPYGLFTLNYKAHPSNDPSTILFTGFLKTKVSNGQVLLEHAERQEGDTPDAPREIRKAVLQKTGDSGTGTVYELSNYDSQNPNQVTQFDIAFDTANFLRDDGDTPVCLDRTAFEESAWSYGLYDEAGARVTRNSGFPIKKGSNYGWVGYWGLSLPDGVTVADGETVYKHIYQDNSDVPYTVVKAKGKLKRHTQKLLTLGDIKNVPLNLSDCSGGPCTNYQVVWTGSSFSEVAQQSQDYTWQNITPVDLDLSALPWTDLNFWSQSLGGQVHVTLTGCNYDPMTNKNDCSSAATNTTPVVFYAEDIVYPDDQVPASLSCFDGCPKAIDDMLGGKIDPAAPQLPYPGQTPYSYAFASSTMLLSYGGFAAVQKDDINSWGVMSGPLFENIQANLDLLKCDWDANQVCGWKAWSVLPVFYTWETGLRDYNQFTALKSGSTIVKFQPPLQVEYTHLQADNTKPDYKYNNVKFYLDYSGFGQLNGIPGKCVDMDTGGTVNCGPNTRWVPEFMIPDKQGGSLTEVNADGTNYVIKALEKEQRMMGVDATVCSDAGLTTTTYSPLPDVATGWVDPGLDTEPVVTDAPAVIGGVVQ